MAYDYCWSADAFIEEFERRCRRRVARATRRRVACWDDAATWHPPHRNPHARADLHRLAQTAGRDAWRAEVDALASLGRPVPASLLRHLWAMHEQRLRHSSSSAADQTRLEHLDALRRLFDFTDTPTQHPPTSPPDPHDPSPTLPPGPSLDQHVFSDATGPTLDAFAASIADGTAQPGLHCLAGARGSGKTTTLNRIAWFARHRVVVRRDLGPPLGAGTFSATLLADLCDAVVAHCRRPPQSKPLQPNPILFALGHLADFCRANFKRAAVLTAPVVLCALWLTFSTDRPFPGSLYTLAAALLSVVYLGCCAAVARIVSRPLSAWTAFLLVAFWPAAALLCQFAGYAPAEVLHRTATSAAPNPTAFAAFALATVACTGVAFLFSPLWWSAYSRAAAIRATLRRSSDTDPLASLPAQDLIADCGRTFGGAIFLIDNADLLPIKDLQQFLRLLRPLAIHPSVRIVLAVPHYLHAALRDGGPADLQAVAPHCHLLGSPLPAADAGYDDAFAADHRRDVDDRLRDLLLSRLRFRLSDAPPATEPPLSLALSPWLHAPVAVRAEVLRQIHVAPPTRRDLIRECEAVLLDPARRPFPALPGPDPAAERDLIRRLSAEYHGQERALVAEIVQRVAGTDARVRLLPPPTDLPPAQPLDAIPHLDLPTYYVANPPRRPTSDPA